MIPAERRDYVRAIQAAPDAETKIARYAAAITAIAPRMALVLGIIRQAAPTEPELAALWTEIAARRAANMRLFVADLATIAPLRLDRDQAADIVWATNAAEMYQLLVGQRGWTPQRYQRFLTDTWQRLLRADQVGDPESSSGVAGVRMRDTPVFMSDVAVEGVRDGDLAEILRNYERFWGDRDPPRYVHHPMFFLEFGDTAFVARDLDSGGIAGYLLGFVAPAGDGYIHFVAVRDDSRTLGLGRRVTCAPGRRAGWLYDGHERTDPAVRR